MCKWGNCVNLLVNIPAGLSHTEQSRWEYKAVDQCIAPLVQALNEAGILTASSCCGHGKTNGSILLQDGRELIIRNQRGAMMDENGNFEQWCIVEIMGHKRLAGLVQETTLAGVAMLRVDVPETSNRPGFTQIYGGQAIYCLTPVEEKVARAMAESFNEKPIEEYRISHLLVAGKTEEVEYDPDRDDPGWGDEEL